jgi:hypothetical protein
MSELMAIDARTPPSKWLAWRPRCHLVFLWPRGIAYLRRLIVRSSEWVGRNCRGAARRPAFLAFRLLAPFGVIVGVAVVGEVTIFPLALSIYAVCGEWLLLALLSPIVWLNELRRRA